MVLISRRRRSNQGRRPSVLPFSSSTLEPERIPMIPHDDRRMLEAILCTLVAQAGGSVTLCVPTIAACGSAYQLAPQADWDGETVTLTLEAAPSAPPCEQPRGKRVGSPQRLPTRRH